MSAHFFRNPGSPARFFVKGAAMQTFRVASLLLALASCGLRAQNAAPAPLSQTTTPVSTEPAERQIRKIVAFITMHCVRPGPPAMVVTAQGTGFFVSVYDTRLPPDRHFTYFVTNRHVAMCWDNRNIPMQVQSVSVRLNLKDGSSAEVTNPGNLNWILPPDDSVDLALFAGAPDPSIYDFLDISESSFATDEVIGKESISEGLKIIFSGFFYQVPGLNRMEPILREGIIAMMPAGNLMTTTGKLGKVYLGEVHAFHGNSGSPVFVDVRSRGGIGYDYRLLGVVSGGYSEGEQNDLVLETPLENKLGNSGIAMIVPASELKKLLGDPRVLAEQDAAVAHQTPANR
jgi:hypothetical protein